MTIKSAWKPVLALCLMQILLACSAARASGASALAELEGIERASASLQVEARALKDRSFEMQSSRALAEAASQASRRRLDALAHGVGTRCAALYRLARRGMARLVLEAASPVEMRRRFHYLLVILRHDRERIRAYADELERHEAALARLDEEEEALRALRAQLEAKQRALGDRDSERAALTQRLRSERGLAVRAALETQQAREDLTKQMVRLDVPAATPPSARASGTETSSPSSLFRASYGRLPWPLKGRIQRAFGPYKDEMTGVEGRNNGLDIEAPLGTPFRAVFDGRVSKAGYLRGYGQTVVVEHGAWTSVYAHANGISVGPGQEVLQGEVLGHVGNSGLLDAGAPRLHFEIRFNATPQDPSPWFGKVADR